MSRNSKPKLVKPDPFKPPSDAVHMFGNRLDDGGEFDQYRPPSKAAIRLGNADRLVDTLAHDALIDFVKYHGIKEFSRLVNVKRTTISKYMNRSAQWPLSRLARWGVALKLDKDQRDALRILAEVTQIHEWLLYRIDIKSAVTTWAPKLLGPLRRRQRGHKNN